MKNYETIISNFGYLHESYMRTLSAKTHLMQDSFMHWCKENEELEAKRDKAEKAVNEYLEELSHTYFHEMDDIAKTLEKSDKVNLSNLLKRF